MKIIKNFYYHYLHPNSKNSTPPRDAKCEFELQQTKIFADLDNNLNIIKQTLGESDDIVIREFKIGLDQAKALLLYIDGLVDKAFIAENIIKSLMELSPLTNSPLPKGSRMWTLIRESILNAGEVTEAIDFDAMFAGILSGDTALFIAGFDKALLISTKGFATRDVKEPETESVIRGPREGFTEALRTNTALIRRKIKNPNLRFETLAIGRQTKTNVCIGYIKGICNEKIVAEVKKRLSRIETDAILESGYVEAFIEDAPFSPFPTIGNTEKPDIAAAKMLEGRVTIIVNGTPMVLTVPNLFIEGFQSNEDYYSRPYYATLIRWFRYLAFFLTVYLPSIYVAVTTFHQEMIPTPLLITMAAAREGTPFPALVEALIMGTTFELLREAGVRMPRPVGQAVSIVGALVIGEAAVSAGLIGAPMVIIVALTAITSFIVASKTDVATLLRLFLTLVAGVAGVYGIILGTLVVIIHLAALRSFGIPHLSPVAPLTLQDLKDVLIRAPLWAMNTRPRILGRVKSSKQGYPLKPLPPPKDENQY